MVDSVNNSHLNDNYTTLSKLGSNSLYKDTHSFYSYSIFVIWLLFILAFCQRFPLCSISHSKQTHKCNHFTIPHHVLIITYKTKSSGTDMHMNWLSSILEPFAVVIISIQAAHQRYPCHLTKTGILHWNVSSEQEKHFLSGS